MDYIVATGPTSREALIAAGSTLGFFASAAGGSTPERASVTMMAVSHRRTFRSPDEFFFAVERTVAELNRMGRSAAAAELVEALGYLNGLTDGWALFLESVERISATLSSELGAECPRDLDDLREAARVAVFRQ